MYAENLFHFDDDVLMNTIEWDNQNVAPPINDDNFSHWDMEPTKSYSFNSNSDISTFDTEEERFQFQTKNSYSASSFEADSYEYYYNVRSDYSSSSLGYIPSSIEDFYVARVEQTPPSISMDSYDMGLNYGNSQLVNTETRNVHNVPLIMEPISDTPFSSNFGRNDQQNVSQTNDFNYSQGNGNYLHPNEHNFGQNHVNANYMQNNQNDHSLNPRNGNFVHQRSGNFMHQRNEQNLNLSPQSLSPRNGNFFHQRNENFVLQQNINQQEQSFNHGPQSLSPRNGNFVHQRSVHQQQEMHMSPRENGMLSVSAPGDRMSISPVNSPRINSAQNLSTSLPKKMSKRKKSASTSNIHQKDESKTRRKRPRTKDSNIDFTAYGLPEDFRMTASKSPIMEAMSFCALKNWGLYVKESSEDKVVFRVTSFEKYYKYSRAICSKQNPTEEIGARVKALRRWFSNFPRKKYRQENPEFDLEVKSASAKKVYDMLNKHQAILKSPGKRRRLE